MKLYAGNKICDVYRLRSLGDAHVAIPEKYSEVIEKAVEEFGSLEKVPVERTIPGISIDITDGAFTLNNEEHEDDIIMNRIIFL